MLRKLVSSAFKSMTAERTPSLLPVRMSSTAKVSHQFLKFSFLQNIMDDGYQITHQEKAIFSNAELSITHEEQTVLNNETQKEVLHSKKMTVKSKDHVATMTIQSGLKNSQVSLTSSKDNKKSECTLEETTPENQHEKILKFLGEGNSLATNLFSAAMKGKSTESFLREAGAEVLREAEAEVMSLHPSQH